MATLARICVVLVLGLLLASGPALAASDNNGGLTEKRDPNYVKAEGYVKNGNYDAAIPLLEQVTAADPTNADAHNYMGYSLRQLERFDEAMAAYQTALRLDPDHRGANEYLGELYLQLGQLDKAEERLDVLDDACFFGCEEYSDLKKAIEDYKAKQDAS